MNKPSKSPKEVINQDSKVIKAIYEGEIKLSDAAEPLSVAVLEDGTRLISRNAVFRAFGRTKRGRAIGENRAENLPSFADAKNLQPYMSGELYDILTNPIRCKTKAGPIIDGYKAEVLPLLCDAYLDANNDGKLTASQQPLAVVSLILVRALSKLGIIALIDEATGYQYDREKDELQKILKAYVAAELLPWQRQFPDIFYKEIFRLNGWDFTVRGIKQRPGIIGRWTNTLIYEQLPPGVLAELKKKTPKSAAGNYSAKLHQSLTPDLGQIHLQNQLAAVITLFQISDNWQSFMVQFNKLVSRKLGQQEINFEPASKHNQLPKSSNSFDQNLRGILAVPPPQK